MRKKRNRHPHTVGIVFGIMLGVLAVVALWVFLPREKTGGIKPVQQVRTCSKIPARAVPSSRPRAGHFDTLGAIRNNQAMSGQAQAGMALPNPVKTEPAVPPAAVVYQPLTPALTQGESGWYDTDAAVRANMAAGPAPVEPNASALPPEKPKAKGCAPWEWILNLFR